MSNRIRRTLEGRSLGAKQAIRLLLAELELEEREANAMPRVELIRRVNDHQVMLKNAAQVDYVFGPELSSNAELGSGGRPEAREPPSDDLRAAVERPWYWWLWPPNWRRRA